MVLAIDFILIMSILGDTSSGLVVIGDFDSSNLRTNLSPNAMLDVISTGSRLEQSIPLFRVAGTGGTLISATDNVSTGVIFSVSDIGGLPFISVDASGDIKLNQFSGATQVSGLLTAATGVTLQRNTPATTTDKLYNVSGSLYFNGSGVGGGGGGTTYTAGSGLTT